MRVQINAMPAFIGAEAVRSVTCAYAPKECRYICAKKQNHKNVVCDIDKITNMWYNLIAG